MFVAASLLAVLVLLLACLRESANVFHDVVITGSARQFLASETSNAGLAPVL